MFRSKSILAKQVSDNIFLYYVIYERNQPFQFKTE
jgi:hypothetical protein